MSVMTSQWPPSQVEPVTEQWTVEDLREGDLVFSAREQGPLAFLNKVANEPWRHVGSLIVGDAGQMMVVETFGERFQLRALGEFMEAYDTYGAVRLDVSNECMSAANEWMSRKITELHVYPWDDLILAGVIALTQRGVFRGQRDRVRRALAKAAESCKEQMESRGVVSLTCSAFVQVAYDTAGGSCAILHERWRSATPWPQQLESLDAFFDDPSDAVETVFGEASILDLLALSEATYRSAAGSRAKPDQLGECAWVIANAVGGYLLPGPPPQAIGSDGRWVTPGDLWRSSSVRARAELTR